MHKNQFGQEETVTVLLLSLHRIVACESVFSAAKNVRMHTKIIQLEGLFLRSTHVGFLKLSPAPREPSSVDARLSWRAVRCKPRDIDILA